MSEDKELYNQHEEKSIHELLHEKLRSEEKKEKDNPDIPIDDLLKDLKKTEYNIVRESIQPKVVEPKEPPVDIEKIKKEKAEALIMESKTKINQEVTGLSAKILKEVKDYALILLIALVVSTLVSTLLFTISNVRETSMEPTLIENDVMILNRLAYAISDPEPGDIVVLLNTDNVDMSFIGRVKRMYVDLWNKINGIEVKDRLVKRIVGVAGDELDIIEGRLYINGEVESFAEIDVETPTRNYFEFPIIVPEGTVFVLGDNRPVSKDSRSFGFVDLEQIEGKVSFRIFPFNRIGVVK